MVGVGREGREGGGKGKGLGVIVGPFTLLSTSESNIISVQIMKKMIYTVCLSIRAPYYS